MHAPSFAPDTPPQSPSPGYTPSDSLWRGYLRCHKALSRQMAILHSAGGAAWMVGKLLYKMQSQRLYRAQFPSLVECAKGEWQLSPELVKGLQNLSQVHSQKEASEAGALPLLLVKNLTEQAQAGADFGEILKKAQPGQMDQQTALRAAKDAQGEGATLEQAKQIYENTLTRLKDERHKRTEERHKRSEALLRKPFTPVPWVAPLQEGAGAELIELQTQVKAELRKAAPALHQMNGGVRKLCSLFASCPSEVQLTGKEPLALMEDALSIYLHMPSLLASLALHLSEQDRSKWLADLPGDPALEKAYQRASQKADEKAVEPEPDKAVEPEPDKAANGKRPLRRRRSGLLISILFLVSFLSLGKVAATLPLPAAATDQGVEVAAAAPPFTGRVPRSSGSAWRRAEGYPGAAPGSRETSSSLGFVYDCSLEGPRIEDVSRLVGWLGCRGCPFVPYD